MTSPTGRGLSGQGWRGLVAVWSLVFAAPHFYWAGGGRAGLGADKAAADAAFEQTWFAAYNLGTAFLAIGGAASAVALGGAREHPRVRRWLSNAAAGASGILLLRGSAGLVLLAVSLADGSFDEQAPPILLAIEPWFVLGGVAFGGMALSERRARTADAPTG